MNATQITAVQPIHLYCVPRFHSPGSHASPARSRRKIGIAYAM